MIAHLILAVMEEHVSTHTMDTIVGKQNNPYLMIETYCNIVSHPFMSYYACFVKNFRCPDNWEGPNCDIDVNECEEFEGTDLGCKNGATCQNTPGGYT